MKAGDLVKLACKPQLGTGLVVDQSPTARACAEEPRYTPIFRVQWMPGMGRAWYSSGELEIVSEGG